MLDYDKSQELMLAEEAKHLESIQEIPGLNPDVVAAMCSLYRAGWRDCWMEEAKARLCVVLNVSPTFKEGSADDVR
jgi:hypothetical protein